MKKTILLVAVVALAATLFVPATIAAPSPERVLPRAASGTWSWVNTGWNVWKTTPKGVEFATGSEDGTWTGTFEGTSADSFSGRFKPSGAFFGLLTVKFEGTVEGLEGTLEILTTFEVTKEDLTAPMSGTWMIVTGTGELANTCGMGHWVYEGADPEHASYTGNLEDCVPPA